MSDEHRCQCEGCSSTDTVACTLDDETGDPDYFCIEHAPFMGHCYICGQFWGGIESFDFGPGYCEHCRGDIRSDEDDGDS